MVYETNSENAENIRQFSLPALAKVLKVEPLVSNGSGNRLNVTLIFSSYPIYNDKPDPSAESVIFMDTTLWDEQAVQLSRTLGKNDIVLVGGQIANDTWTDKTTGEVRTSKSPKLKAYTFEVLAKATPRKGDTRRAPVLQRATAADLDLSIFDE